MEEGRRRGEENEERTARLANLISQQWQSCPPRATVQYVINLMGTSNFLFNLRIVFNSNFIYSKDKESQANKEIPYSALWHYRMHIPAYLLYMH